jgi:putative glutamine amidotransferase
VPQSVLHLFFSQHEHTMKPLIGISVSNKRDASDLTETYTLPMPYAQAVAEAGGLPVLIPNGLQTDTLQALLEHLDGLLLSGGGDVHPKFYDAEPVPTLRAVDEARDLCELTLARRAFISHTPCLAICRGIQVINVALGGSLIRDIKAEFATSIDHDLQDQPSTLLAHRVRIRRGSKLAEIFGEGEIETNSRHHQAIQNVAPKLRIVAEAPDGIIEAVEAHGHPFFIGVQWHPERLLDRHESRVLFERLTESASKEYASPHGR